MWRDIRPVRSTDLVKTNTYWRFLPVKLIFDGHNVLNIPGNVWNVLIISVVVWKHCYFGLRTSNVKSFISTFLERNCKRAKFHKMPKICLNCAPWKRCNYWERTSVATSWRTGVIKPVQERASVFVLIWLLKFELIDAETSNVSPFSFNVYHIELTLIIIN